MLRRVVVEGGPNAAQAPRWVRNKEAESGMRRLEVPDRSQTLEVAYGVYCVVPGGWILEWRGQGCGPSAGVLTYVFFMLGPTGQELEYPYRFPSNYVFLSENHHLSHVDIVVHVAEDSEVVYNIYLL